MTLYKYYPTTRFFENRMVRFTQPSALNDPDEALPKLSFGRFTEEDYAVAREKAARVGFRPSTDRELEAVFMTPFPSRRFDEVSFPGLWPAKEPRLRPEPFATIAEFDRAVAERAVELVGELADRSIGIFSLSRILSEPMRAYYSNSHAGLVVGFDENHPFFTGSCFEVEYSDTPFTISSNDGWVRILGSTIKGDDILESRLTAVPLKLFLRKRPDWRHEQEIRLIAPLKKADRTVQAGEDGYPIHLFEIPPDAVRLVEFGYAASDDFVARAMSHIADTPGWEQLSVWRRRRLRSRQIDVERIQ
ncbi:DUF2971 domain-containing protein [Methylorubrum thiocyanatum]|uniref:DUF2971 domain-containing protein n=1 Tax=Methylorubrum thiocyanatum TaxID=47958 RepID=UPI0036465D57